jgi:transposase
LTGLEFPKRSRRSRSVVESLPQGAYSMSKQAKSSGVNAGKVYNQYSDDFRRDAVAMIESEGLTTAEVGRRLGVNANLLRKWRQKYGKKSPSQEVQCELESENRRLREENRRLLMEREILKKAAAFFANEKN